MKTHIPNANTIERTRRFDGGDAMLDLIYQAAKAVHDVEARVASANETERYTRSIAETAVKTLQDAVKRIQELGSTARKFTCETAVSAAYKNTRGGRPPYNDDACRTRPSEDYRDRRLLPAEHR